VLVGWGGFTSIDLLRGKNGVPVATKKANPRRAPRTPQERRPRWCGRIGVCGGRLRACVWRSRRLKLDAFEERALNFIVGADQAQDVLPPRFFLGQGLRSLLGARKIANNPKIHLILVL
jgi:hypothetical protein